MLDGIFFGSKGLFPKKNWAQKSEILYLFLAEKMVICFVASFVASFSDFGSLSFLIEALIEIRKLLARKKLFDVRFGNCLTPKVPRSCRFTGFTEKLQT